MSHVMLAPLSRSCHLALDCCAAGMNVLCSDKTGTLTQNKLSLNDPIIFSDTLSRDDLVFYAACCSKRSGSQDAIDYCIIKDLSPKYRWGARVTCLPCVPAYARCVQGGTWGVLFTSSH